MQIVFLTKFHKDLVKTNQPRVLASIKEIVLEIEKANSIQQIYNLKKL